MVVPAVIIAAAAAVVVAVVVDAVAILAALVLPRRVLNHPDCRCISPSGHRSRGHKQMSVQHLAHTEKQDACRQQRKHQH